RGSDRSAFVFIHGFNTSFDDAAYRTAELAYDLNFPGVPMMYSWASAESLPAYFEDLETAKWSAPHLQEFLQKVAERSGAKSIHLIAHSMGNRVLTQALVDMPASGSPLFDDVIMAAPDLDAETFTRNWQQLPQIAKRFTLYASSTDRVLRLASNLPRARYARLGWGGADIVVLPGLDSIDATGIDTSLLGHSYEGCKPVVDDLRLLFDKALPASRRSLRNRVKNDLAYWVFP
ncbi:MAG: alpha/beta fold hydrolase, partial [Verrucomicrobiota bacterium]|nr:alpha/beta fold hydrolase [Verrucomicrobiota bacterium]